MAVQKNFEILEGRVASGNREGGASYTRVFSVWTTTPNTKLSDVILAPKIVLGDVHPDDPTAIASSFDCAQTDSLLRYHVSITYTTCATLQADGTCGDGGLPAVTWTGSTAVRQLPVEFDINDKKIVNSAGQAIPDIQADIATMTLTCVKYYLTCADLFIALDAFTNKVNATEWCGFAANWWKCQGASWNTERRNVCGTKALVYQSTWTFELDARAWTLLPLNVGYMHLVTKFIADDPDDETVTLLAEIIDEISNTPTSAPRLLDAAGEVLPIAKLPPTRDEWIAKDAAGSVGFTIYSPAEFKLEFGEPCTPLVQTPCPDPTDTGSNK